MSSTQPGVAGHRPAGRIRTEIDRALAGFVAARRPEVLAISPDLAAPLAVLDDLLGGGKRLRPVFCYWGWRAAGGADATVPEPAADGAGNGIATAAAALELLQVSALIHDDVMDASDTRRGRPSAHRRFEAMRRDASWPGAAARFGAGAAILLGDLCLAWSAEMFGTSDLPPDRLRAGAAVFDEMRTEVICGQYLDLLEGARGPGTVADALRVVEFKSAKYTVERPLQLGATLAGASPEVVAGLRAYGLPLGIAFQLRDDVLGVFGDPAETGKPAGDDLREGKRTALVALTLERAAPAKAKTLEAGLGDPGLTPDRVAELRSIIVDSGGLAACEEMIDGYTARAGDALERAPVAAQARRALAELAVTATARRL